MSELRYIYQYEIVAVLLSLLSAFILLERKNLKRNRNVLFFCLLILTAVSGVLDVVANIMINIIEKERAAGVPITVDMNALEFLQGAFLFFHNMAPLFWFAYVNKMIGKYKNSRLFFSLSSIPCTISILLIVTNPFTHFVFYFEDYSYKHGGGILLLYLIAAGYLIVSLYEAVRYRRVLPKGHALLCVVYIVAAGLAIAVQFFVENLLIELFVSALALFFMTFTFETEDQARNPVTKLYNRPSFIYETRRILYHHDKRELVIMKLADLGHLNSSLGVDVVMNAMREVGAFFQTIEGCRYFDCDDGNISILFENEARRDEKMMLIKERFKQSFGINEQHVHFNPEYYYLSLPSDTESLEEISLIINSEYKTPGNYGKEVLDNLKRQHQVEEALTRAIDNKSILVYYQPIFSREKNRIDSAEALARINDEELGFISPGEFIPIAEKTGRITALGRIVFEKVLKLWSEHREELKNIDYIEVNLSPIQIMDPDTYKSFSKIMEKYDVDPSSINFEITESSFIENKEQALSMMNEFCNDGFTFSLDDFGTGYSNFINLYDMNIKLVKFDKSILDKSDVNEDADKTLQLMTRMLKDIRFKVLQEGVETKEQEDKLLEYGIDYIQGYYHSKPLPEESFLSFVSQN